MTTTIEATYSKGVFVPKIKPTNVINDQTIYITISTKPILQGDQDVFDYLTMRKDTTLNDIVQLQKQKPGIDLLLSQRVGLGHQK